MQRDLIKNDYLTFLYDYYKNLLTLKQKKYFELYYFEDHSLAEIADLNNVSRNAIYSSLSQVDNLLNYYEKCLKLYKKSQLREQVYKKITDQKVLNELEGIDNL